MSDHKFRDIIAFAVWSYGTAIAVGVAIGIWIGVTLL